MPEILPLSQPFRKTCIIGIPFQATFAANSFVDLHGRTWRNLFPLRLAAKLLGEPDELRQGTFIPGHAFRLTSHPPAPSAGATRFESFGTCP